MAPGLGLGGGTTGLLPAIFSGSPGARVALDGHVPPGAESGVDGAPVVPTAADAAGFILSRTAAATGLTARNNIPLVTGELLKPVSETSSAASKPACCNNARKTFPGMAPPSHLAQFSTRALVSWGNSPARTWSASQNLPPGFKTR